MLAAHLNDVKHLRDRAAETRVLSATMKDIEIQAIMTRLADHYDTLADRAQARANGTAVIERLTAKAAGRPPRARAKRQELADDKAADLAPIIESQQAAGKTSLRAIAAGLNEAGIPPARGGEWSAVQVQRVMSR